VVNGISLGSQSATRSVLPQPWWVRSSDLLLADEPTSDLDEQIEQEIMSLLRKIHGTGVTILMVTHRLELLPFATRAMRMESGKLREIAAEVETRTAASVAQLMEVST